MKGKIFKTGILALLLGVSLTGVSGDAVTEAEAGATAFTAEGVLDRGFSGKLGSGVVDAGPVATPPSKEVEHVSPHLQLWDGLTEEEKAQKILVSKEIVIEKVVDAMLV